MNSLMQTQNGKHYLIAPSNVLADPLGGVSFVSIISNVDFLINITDDPTGLVDTRFTDAWATGTCTINIASTRQTEQSRFAIITLQPENSSIAPVQIMFSQMGSGIK